MRKFAVILCGSSLLLAPAQACDLCSVYTANEAKEVKPGFFLGVFEQYTHFGTMQQDGKEVGNPVDQTMDSFITQGMIGYRFNPCFGVHDCGSGRSANC